MYGRNAFQNLVAAFIVGTSGAAVAGGGLTGGSTEITQILNNGELAAQVAQQVQTVSKLVEQFNLQKNQFAQQLLAGKKMDDLSIQDIMRQQQALDAYQSSLGSLKLDLGRLSGTFDNRITEARIQNITLKDYVQRENLRIANGNSAARARVVREQEQMEQVKSDIQIVRKYGDQIPATIGVHQSTQLLNSQMNLLLQQMTRLVALTSEAQGSDKGAAISKEEENRLAHSDAVKKIMQKDMDRSNANKALIGTMRSQ